MEADKGRAKQEDGSSSRSLLECEKCKTDQSVVTVAGPFKYMKLCYNCLGKWHVE